jgi:ubiquinone/menaquinone biosynthesis C-methylase UbiE
MTTMQNKAEDVKKDIDEFYDKQSAEKTQNLDAWLNSGSLRIPQPRSYYYFEDRKIRVALQMANLKKGARILEVGCNLGQMSFPLSEMGYDVTGFDLSENAIAKAKLRTDHFKAKNVSFEVQDAESYKGHPNEEFDAVFSFSAFRYFPNPINALKESFRVLKKGGCAVIDFPNKNCPWFNIIKKGFLIKGHIHDRLFTVPQVRSLLEEAGFKDITSKIYLFAYKELPSALLPLMKTADFVLERIPGIRNTAAIIMVKGTKR